VDAHLTFLTLLNAMAAELKCFNPVIAGSFGTILFAASPNASGNKPAFVLNVSSAGAVELARQLLPVPQSTSTPELP
jgi:hypothetical protein